MTLRAPLLVGEELEKEYRTGPEVLRVLRGASIVVGAGEMVALVGASGEISGVIGSPSAIRRAHEPSAAAMNRPSFLRTRPWNARVLLSTVQVGLSDEVASLTVAPVFTSATSSLPGNNASFVPSGDQTISGPLPTHSSTTTRRAVPSAFTT